MRDTEELTILAGLLDFYSDRATAHASFVVAAIFGVYTIFAIYSSLNDMLFLSFPFLFLVAFELYSFLNFGHYAAKAYVVRNMLLGTHQVEYDRQITDRYRKRSHGFFGKYEGLKTVIVGKQRQPIVWWFLAFLLVAQVLPWLAIVWSPIRETVPFINIPFVYVVMVMCVLVPITITAYAFAQRRKTEE